MLNKECLTLHVQICQTVCLKKCKKKKKVTGLLCQNVKRTLSISTLKEIKSVVAIVKYVLKLGNVIFLVIECSGASCKKNKNKYFKTELNLTF